MKQIVNCPNCSEKFVVEVNVTPVDSTVSVIPSKAQQRIDAVKAKGIPVSDLFLMRGADGEDCIARLGNGGVFSLVRDDDPIFEYIEEKGRVENRRLFRRWVAGQVAYLSTREEDGHVLGFTKALQKLGYTYQFRMVREELRVQEILSRKDEAEYQARNMSFYTEGIACMLIEDIKKTEKFINRLPAKGRKNKPYKSIRGYGKVFVADIKEKVLDVLDAAQNDVMNAKSPKELLDAFDAYMGVRIRLDFNTKMCPSFIEMYKHAGAFYTMQNFIRFHGCYVINDNGETLTKADAEEYLNQKAEEYHFLEGWRLFGMMKKMFTDNNIDLNRKRIEWRKK